MKRSCNKRYNKISQKDFEILKLNDNIQDNSENSFETISKIEKEFDLELNENNHSFAKDLSSLMKSNKNVPDNYDSTMNTCCKDCLKMFSKNHKACMCQVPIESIRNKNLSKEGCFVCGCKGCNPKDLKKEIWNKDYNNNSKNIKSISLRKEKKDLITKNQ